LGWEVLVARRERESQGIKFKLFLLKVVEFLCKYNEKCKKGSLAFTTKKMLMRRIRKESGKLGLVETILQSQIDESLNLDLVPLVNVIVL
jgi:hypothetical protein